MLVMFLFLGVSPAPSYLRLCTASLPALIILVWYVSQPGKLEQGTFKFLNLLASLCAPTEPVIRQRHWRAYLEFPDGPDSTSILLRMMNIDGRLDLPAIEISLPGLSHGHRGVMDQKV